MNKRIFGLVAVATFGFGLVACGPSSDEALEEASDAAQISATTYPQEVPLLQLPEGVTPRRYALDLNLDPGAESFTGTVAIDLQIETPVFFIFLHGEDVQVSSARLVTGEG
ncbi:MAG: hypothetical protein EP347_03315, partial [Alphaproteobacteria bacterium]